METVIGSLPLLLSGAGVTIYLSIICLILSTTIGVTLGILSVIGGPVIKGLTGLYVYVIRGIPVLVQLFLVYFTLPYLGIYLPGVVAGALGISFYGGAFISEIVRGGILSVPKGQVDAGTALGYTSGAVMRRVVLPQALLYMLPPYVSTTALVVKATALVSIVSVWELTLAARELAQRTVETLPIVSATLLIYFAICYPLAFAGKQLEKRFAHVA